MTTDATTEPPGGGEVTTTGMSDIPAGTRVRFNHELGTFSSPERHGSWTGRKVNKGDTGTYHSDAEFGDYHFFAVTVDGHDLFCVAHRSMFTMEEQ